VINGVANDALRITLFGNAQSWNYEQYQQEDRTFVHSEFDPHVVSLLSISHSPISA
jgi:hypothetical protein